jgi:hypothetical protein
MTNKTPIISITADDCEWSYTKGTGKGGQKKNKTSSAVHCMHRPSGARAFSQDDRSQLRNRQDAFKKMTETKEFKTWLKLETAKKLGIIDDINKTVDKAMAAKNLKIEGKDESGRWSEEAVLPENNPK